MTSLLKISTNNRKKKIRTPEILNSPWELENQGFFGFLFRPLKALGPSSVSKFGVLHMCTHVTFECAVHMPKKTLKSHS